MGCIWSNNVHAQRCRRCGRKAGDNLVLVEQLCEICRLNLRRQREALTESTHVSYYVIHTRQQTTTRNQKKYKPKAAKANTAPLYGEYKCVCGNTWDSRLSWPNSYQACRRCRRQVRAHMQRELLPSDRATDPTKAQAHPEELCQKCISLGHHCGAFKKNKSALQ